MGRGYFRGWFIGDRREAQGARRKVKVECLSLIVGDHSENNPKVKGNLGEDWGFLPHMFKNGHFTARSLLSLKTRSSPMVFFLFLFAGKKEKG